MKPAAKRAKTVSEVIQNGSLGLLKTQIRLLKSAQDRHGDDLDELKKLTDAVGGMARAAAAILAEQRKQAVAAKDAVDELDTDQRVDLFLGMLEELPIEARQRIAEKLLELGGGLL